jgi:ABC-type bacteriocin/lantibiotic exporter with double-glycine peptidase domain
LYERAPQFLKLIFATKRYAFVPKISIDNFRQPHPDYCVPACIKMIYDHLRKIYGEDELPAVLISKIAHTMKTDTKYGGQTIIDNVSLVNKLFETKRFCIKFIPKYPCEWKIAIDENLKGNPVIAWIWDSNKNEPEKGTGHSVVITNINRDLGTVELNDPARGQRSVNIIEFISQWENENVNRTLILLQVERKVETKLQDFNPPEEKVVECAEND